MNSTNLNIILTNAVCCSARLATEVSKLYSIGDKCTDSELAKLKLLNDYIETLRCYKIDSVNSIFILRQTINDYDEGYNEISSSSLLYTATLNGTVYSLQGDGVTSVGEIYSELTMSLPNIINYYTIFDNTYAYTYVIFNCLAKTLLGGVSDLKGDNIVNFKYTLIQEGNCNIKNCLTEEEYNILIKYVMSTCDICECQLNQ